MSKRANGERTIWQKPDGRWCGATYAPTNKGGRKPVYVYGRTRAQAREKLTELQRDVDRRVTLPAEHTGTSTATSTTGGRRWSSRTGCPRPTRATRWPCGGTSFP